MSLVKPMHKLNSVIQHVELNREGWWYESLKHFVLAILWLQKEPLSETQIGLSLTNELGLSITNDQLISATKELSKIGDIIECADSRFKLSEQKRSEYDSEVLDNEKLEARVKARFISLSKQICEDLFIDELWDKFLETLLVPLIRELGAQTYELITGGSIEYRSVESYQAFLNAYLPKEQDHLRQLIQEFLNPNDVDTRTFVLKLLDSYFTLEAGNLGDETIQALASSASKRASITIFVDTNIILSVLDLHDNPANETVAYVMDLIREASRFIPVSIKVLPLTIEETQNTLNYYSASLEGPLYSAQLASSSSKWMSGIYKRFFERCAKSKKALSSTEYFNPYIKNLIPLLRDKGIVLHNAKVTMTQDMIDDINVELKYSDEHPEHAKGYEQIAHDVQLWHFVRSSRPPLVQQPLEAKTWVVTIDRKFLNYDRYKLRNEKLSVQVCIDPGVLAQMLQFWVPRSELFEKVLFGSLRTPLLLRQFAPHAERMCVKIIRASARFSNSEEFTEEMVGEMLTNEALQQKIASEHSPEEEPKIIESYLIEKVRELQEENAALKQPSPTVSHSPVEIAASSPPENTDSPLVPRLLQQLSELSTLISDLKSQNEDLKLLIKRLEDDNHELSEKVHDFETRQDDNSNRWKRIAVTTLGGIVPACLWLSTLFVCYSILLNEFDKGAAVSISIAILVGLLLSVIWLLIMNKVRVTIREELRPRWLLFVPTLIGWVGILILNILGGGILLCILQAAKAFVK